MTSRFGFTGLVRLATGIGLAACLSIGAAQAQSVEDFYKGKTLGIYSGHSAAGAYSAYARLLERHMGKYVPGNPTTVFKLMEGASGRTLATWLFGAAPKDGLHFGIFHERMGLEHVIAPDVVKFDGRKFTWIGSMDRNTFVCFTWGAKGIKSVDDLKKQEVIVGGTGTDGPSSVFPRMMNAMLGTKFKIITGYAGADELLAVERGEADGRCGFGWDSIKTTRPEWIRDKKIDVLLQFSLQRMPELPDVPTMIELVTNPDDKRVLELVSATNEMGRPFAAPPEIPGDRAAALRDAFVKATKDKDLLADAQKQNIEIDPITAQDIQTLLDELYKTPPEIGARALSFRKPG
jgi:tripartite-type tricarboxylate transporter receptor subunit TctC